MKRTLTVGGHKYHYWIPNEEMARAFDAAISHKHAYMPITGEDQVTIWVCAFCGDETRLSEEAAARASEAQEADKHGRA